MKHCLTLFLWLTISFCTFAQDSTTIDSLLEQGKYTTIVEKYGPLQRKLSLNELWGLGYSYYRLNDDLRSMKYMDIYLMQDSTEAKVYALKGDLLLNRKQYADAKKYLTKAVTLDSTKQMNFYLLSYANYALNNLTEAIKNSQQALAIDSNYMEVQYLLGNLYYESGDKQKALLYFTKVKQLLDFSSNYYPDVIYRIGSLEEEVNQDYQKAASLFCQVIALTPDNYGCYSSLIQCYYHEKQYSLAEPYKKVLYQKYEEGQLGKAESFCIDQFAYKDKYIEVYERFAEDTTQFTYDKHVFVVYNKDNQVELTVQSEFDQLIYQQTNHQTKYMLCASKDDVHYNMNYAFGDSFNYDNLKSKVLECIDKMEQI